MVERLGKLRGSSTTPSDKGKSLAEYFTGAVPIVGSRVTKAIFPNNSGTAQQNNIWQSDKPLLQTLKNVGYSPGSATKKIRGTTLSDTQYKQYVTQSAKLFQQKADSAMSDSSFKSLSAADQKRTLEQALRDARAQTLDQMGVKKTTTTRTPVKKY